MKVGSKHNETKELDITEIAKLIRKDIKEYLGDLKVKPSVRIKRFSMGQSINVEIDDTGFPYDFRQNMRTVIMGIIEQYNYDDSDPMTDYSYVRFYSHVTIS